MPLLLMLMLQPPLSLSVCAQQYNTDHAWQIPATAHASTCNLFVQTWRLQLLWTRCLNTDTVQTRSSCIYPL